MKSKKYDAIAIGTGSAMNIIEAMLRENQDIKVAVIDKDEPGGICLTKGCIPTKILLYPAALPEIAEIVPPDRFLYVCNLVEVLLPCFYKGNGLYLWVSIPVHLVLPFY